jgi:hypothetical protein
VKKIYQFHDAYVRLVLGQSLLERLSSDGHVHNHLFVGGRGEKVGYFEDWLSVLEGPHFRVKIDRPLAAVMTWLCEEGRSLL